MLQKLQELLYKGLVLGLVLREVVLLDFGKLFHEITRSFIPEPFILLRVLFELLLSSPRLLLVRFTLILWLKVEITIYQTRNLALQIFPYMELKSVDFVLV